jgi:hypothetical protein
VFPDFEIKVDELLAEADRVIAFWHFRDTHRASWAWSSSWNAMVRTISGSSDSRHATSPICDRRATDLLTLFP